MSKIPSKISPCPILEVTLEIKFSTNYPKNAIAGVVYNTFKEDFQQFESLPINQIPEEVRLNDPNFKFKVFYKIYGTKYTIQVGYDVITLHCNSPYVGWGQFSTEIKNFVEKLKGTSIIEETISVSLQYLNFFRNNIFKESNVNIEIASNKIEDGKSTIIIEEKHKGNDKILKVANNILVEDFRLNFKEIGSILEITLIIQSPSNFLENPMESINNLHADEKEIFFGLLKESFISTLNPVYHNE